MALPLGVATVTSTPSSWRRYRGPNNCKSSKPLSAKNKAFIKDYPWDEAGDSSSILRHAFRRRKPIPGGRVLHSILASVVPEGVPLGAVRQAAQLDERPHVPHPP